MPAADHHGLAHLVPESRAAALLSNAERLALLPTERWWIAHERAQAALARLDALLRDGPGQIRPPNILLAGPTNNGKSWIVERFVRAHAAPGSEDAERLPVVAMQMPTEPTVSRFYAALLTHVGAPLPRAGPSSRKHELEQLALRVLRGVGARMLVIDELHNMLAGSRTTRGEFLNLLRWLGNELRLPLVGVGTRDAWLAIRTDPQLENRFEPFVLPAWQSGPDTARLLQGFATLLPLRRPSDFRSAEMVRRVIARTGGTIGEMAALIRAAAENRHSRRGGEDHPRCARPCHLSWPQRTTASRGTGAGMTRATRLPLHPRPLPYEALSSWVDRLAAAYELERYEFLRSMLGADPPPDTAELDGGRRPDLIATFADRTGFPPERVRAMTLAGYTPELIDTAVPSAGLFEAYACRFGWLMPTARRTAPRPESSEPWLPWRADDLLDVLPRCCRRCLVEDAIPYVRLHWRLAWMASCPRHGEMLVPLFLWPSLRYLFHERAPDLADPDLLALDRVTLGAVTIGKGVLPESGETVPGGAWLRALRTLIDELVRPVTAIGRMARDEVAAAWLRAGSSLNSRQGWAHRPYEHLLPEQRILLLRVAAAAVQNLAGRLARQGETTALRSCITQWSGDRVCRT